MREEGERRGFERARAALVAAVATALAIALLPGAALASPARAARAARHSLHSLHGLHALGRSGAPGWQLRQSGDLPLGSLDAISCPTVTTCFAIGTESDGAAVVEATADGGTTWALQALPPAAGAGGLSAISCADATHCVAVGPGRNLPANGGVVVATADGGATWNPEPLPGGVAALDGVACPTAGACWAVGSAGAGFGYGYGQGQSVLLESTGGGTSWAAVPIPPPANGLNAIACGSQTACTAVGANGSIITTTDAGATWAAQAPPSDGVDLLALSCANGSDCWAGGVSQTGANQPIGSPSAEGATVIATTDGGRSWSPEPLPIGLAAIGLLSCADATHCMAIALDAAYGETTVVSTVDGGAAWSEATPAAGFAAASIACPSATACLAAGGVVPTSQGSVLSFLGGSSTVGAVLVTTDAGAAWTTEVVPQDAKVVNNVSCADAMHCWAVGAEVGTGGSIHGFIEATSDGGATWRGESPPVDSPLEAISCPDVMHCMAVGGSPLGGLVGPAVVATTSDGGQSWAVDAVPPRVIGLAAVSCTSGTACIVAGAAIVGQSAASPFGVEGDLLVTTDGGERWTEHLQPQALAAMFSISCPTAETCFSAGGGLGALTQGYQVGGAGGVVVKSTDGGTTWTQVTTTPQGAGLYAISCLSVMRCVAVGGSGGGGGRGIVLTTTDGGARWTDEQNLSTAGVPTMTHLSCTSTVDCWATTGMPFTGFGLAVSGEVLSTVNGGASWSAQPLPADAQETLGVDCPAGGSCIAAGATATQWFVVSTANGGWAPPSVTAVSPERGYAYGGTAVTVSGSGFAQGATSVDFGGAASPGVRVTSLDSLTAVSPPGSGTVAITVTTPGGTSSAGSADQFTYVATSPSPTAVPASYDLLDPYRIADTRGGSGEPDTGQALLSGGVLDVQVTGVLPPGQSGGGVPAGATSVVLDVTAISSFAGGYLTVWPTGTPRNVASNLNYAPHQTVSNLVTVPVGAGGAVSVYASQGPTDVVVDVEGFFSPSASDRFTPLVPARVADTRAGSGKGVAGKTLGSGGVLPIQVTGVGGVPASGVDAVVLDVTGTDNTTGGYLTVFPTGSPRPLSSNVNLVPGRAVANTVVAPVGNAGTVSVYASQGPTDVVVDVVGYFSTSGTTQLTAVTPFRVADTRGGSGEPDAGETLRAGTSLAVQVDGVGPVPAAGSPGAPKAVVLDVTVTGTTAPGYLTAWPTGSPRPIASVLNWVAGETVAALVVVPVGTDGAVSLYDAAGSTNVVVDVEGWFS